ncbi:MAG: hypothetical protein CMM84_09230 [Rhodothermaceae bacterium]|nr:hypothetical protein [Rhodothermaceae bacterium]
MGPKKWGSRYVERPAGVPRPLRSRCEGARQTEAGGLSPVVGRGVRGNLDHLGVMPAAPPRFSQHPMRLFRVLLAALLLPLLAGCDLFGSDPTIVEAISAESDLGTLESAILRANLSATLNGEGPFTVFAPTDAAFDAYAAENDISEIELLGATTLSSLLRVHVVAGELSLEDLQVGDVITTLNGEMLTVTTASGTVGLDTEDAGPSSNARITTPDIEASNGVVHKINGVLAPTDT